MNLPEIVRILAYRAAMCCQPPRTARSRGWQHTAFRVPVEVTLSEKINAAYGDPVPHGCARQPWHIRGCEERSNTYPHLIPRAAVVSFHATLPVTVAPGIPAGGRRSPHSAGHPGQGLVAAAPQAA